MTSKSICAAFVVSCALFLAMAAGAEPCVIRSSQDILECALERHPDVALSQASLDRDLQLISVAKQRPNPELQTKIVTGVSDGVADNKLETESSLLHTLELGGKRRARVSQAKAVSQVATAERQKTFEDVALTTVLALHRLRQIRAESGYLRESIETFARLLSPLKARPQLSPEQSVSRSVFEMAQEEYRLKETLLRTEEENLKTSLELATGLPYAAMRNYLPRARVAWPKINVSREWDSVAANSGVLQKAEAEAKVASAQLAAARSQTWPDLKIGPSVDTVTPSGGGRTGTSVGGTISLPLPLLSLNQGGRRFAAAEQVRASLQLQNTRENLATERRLQAARYQNAVKILSQTRSRSNWGARHKAIDDLFERGLAPGALVLEGHRQMIEILRVLNEQEIAALDALWRLYIIDGRVLNEKI